MDTIIANKLIEVFKKPDVFAINIIKIVVHAKRRLKIFGILEKIFKVSFFASDMPNTKQGKFIKIDLLKTSPLI